MTIRRELRGGPEIVCLCGSRRFAPELRATQHALSLDGAIVLAPSEAATPLSPAQRAQLGALHLRRIEHADRVVVVDPGGYVGESVRREIAHARSLGIPVSFTEPPLDAVADAQG